MTQPVAVDAMVQVLLGVATGEIAGDLNEVGGPGRGSLTAMSTAFARSTGDTVE